MEEEEGNIKRVITYWMEGEITAFIKVWISACLSLTYCFFAAKLLPRGGGAARLAAFLPAISVLLLLPLHLHSIHLGLTTAFFLAWLAVFKLLMLASGKGPLSAHPISLPRFIALACLPIRLRSHEEDSGKKNRKGIYNYAIKAVLFAAILKVYDHSDSIHPKILTVVHGFHIYICLELMLAMAAAAASGWLGAELEPQFDEPYLAASLQDLWSRRWNLMVTQILRSSVYIPVQDWATVVVGRKWAPLPAVMLTFLVSGLMHEMMFYYLGRVKPTWEITWFFLLHGVCLAVEIGVKKAVKGRWRMPRIVGMFLTVGFMIVTSFWLFFPLVFRCNGFERGLAEVAAVGALFKDLVRAVKLTVKT